ncbi:hemolysin bl lytic component l2 : : Pmp3 [Gemmata massiliana]|uniref:Hemolysin bl lytic component l2:: Pmp3 n=1 Tax=Gemmata massiliana TaxID=1210884 RepID=A0A6P2CYQ8_9BACT|nr:YqaE/Pmp3 family membrane protein [Gemmata massiliana]VTR92340.1 hemolysin bl lytic component l2 : : Pmp3 [Gemmata massiliana]
MLVVLVVLCPPLAVLLTAPSQTAKNFGLTLLLYVPGVLHARSTVDQYRANRQYASLVRALDRRVEPVRSLRAA